ncbi:MAG: bifunctional diaminohydroxyphosphoribosylaminopyrimidine deaminase/5-amino-6-(5-phosphoribosylamino)uracil reductase RibD [Bacteroidetes bacterium]|nr:bifunctional diaminohydroxyphosphoribosylaminopyrimidine deaminase/5-amino-6-(5-phosphoribosylamino)uracil reductase RibD [Bacteroidota bacterium]
MNWTDEIWMRRCFDLARSGAGSVAPNPMVGAVLVYQNRILGEGFHQQYGGPHAEVQCIRSVSSADRPFMSKATLYCSLEPCAHTGKTPPCVDLILEHRIPKVVVCNIDPNPLVAGKGVGKLKAAGIEVIHGVLENEGAWLNRMFFKWIQHKKPWIILKWAQSKDAYLGKTAQRTSISGPFATRLNHRWRSTIDAILVGNNTALIDNPRLDTRLYGGRPPLRISIDRHGNIPDSHHLLDDSQETWIFGPPRTGNWTNSKFIDQHVPLEIPVLLQKLYEAGKSSLLVEGGALILKTFLDGHFWDEIRVIENAHYLNEGIQAPRIPTRARLVEIQQLQQDSIQVFKQDF